ncbi:hypothetical protein LPUS_06482 [Lasallia pustulata]|uniref:Rhodopsin domain-containing protein n=1 Tax=Lasallia pustulata TaxID=136370 RepID=A0A1W5D1B1_9LECA|nr:hypothetical protein LPUS_06482 [Lasallia pustulata]
MSSAQASPPSFPPGFFEQYTGNAPYGVAIAFIVIESLAVTLRFWARKIGKVAWGADDTLIIPGAILCLALCACSIADVLAGGVGYHEDALRISDPDKLVVWAKFVLIIPEIYLSAVLFPKLAILAIYLRIFNKAPYRITCWVLAAVLVANCIATTIAGFLTCVPLEYLWDPTIPGGHCFDINAYFRWASLTNIVTDVVMLILPLPVIWKIHTSRNVKMGLTFTFATGSIGLVTSIIRFVGFFAKNAEADGPYSAASLIVWTVCESGTYLVAACLPTYRPLALLLWKKDPLASFRQGSKTSKRGQSHTDDDTLDIPLTTHQKTGFTRLADGGFGPANNSQYNVSYAEQGGTPTSDMMDPRGIMVKRDIDVLSV